MRQLSLFKGKRQRGIAPPPPLEFSTDATLADICRRWINPQWKFTHLPLGEASDHQINPKTGKRYSLTGQRLQRMGVAARSSRNACARAVYWCTSHGQSMQNGSNIRIWRNLPHMHSFR
jgi:hypothetical protein